MIVGRHSPAPDEACRALLARWSRDTVPKLAMAVMLAEGGGFRAALVRAVSTALTAVLPHKVTFKFVSTLDDALSALDPLLPRESGGTAALRQVVGTLRSGMALD